MNIFPMSSIGSFSRELEVSVVFVLVDAVETRAEEELGPKSAT